MSDRRIGTVVKVPSIRLRELVERATGVEPATSSLGSWHSTTELHPLLLRSLTEVLAPAKHPTFRRLPSQPSLAKKNPVRFLSCGRFILITPCVAIANLICLSMIGFA